MRLKYLQHKHGGRIVELYGIHHEAPKAGAIGDWHFTGTIERPDGSRAEDRIIEVWALCYDHDNPEAKLECDEALRRVTDYLQKHGEWDDRGWWHAKTRRGSESFGIRRELVWIPA